MMEFLKSIMSSFGKDGAMSGVMDFLGNEGFANLIKGGTSLYGGMQAGDMMDFNKTMANKAAGHQDTLMGNLEEDRQRDKDLDFDFDYKN